MTKNETKVPAALAPAAHKIVETARQKLRAAEADAEMSKAAFMDCAVALERKVPNLTDVDVAKARANHDRARERVEVLTATVEAALRDWTKAAADDLETQAERDWADAERIGGELTALYATINTKQADLDADYGRYIELGAQLGKVSPILRTRRDLTDKWSPGLVGARLKRLSEWGFDAFARLGGAAVVVTGEFAKRRGELRRDERAWIGVFSNRHYTPETTGPTPAEPMPAPSAVEEAMMSTISRAGGAPRRQRFARGLND